MTSNRKPPSPKEAPQEPFKRAVAGCMRALARTPELEVTFAPEKPALIGSGGTAKAAARTAAEAQSARHGDRARPCRRDGATPRLSRQ
jgi:cobalamin biosynthesis protein CobT